jgi:aerobic carbon-monoxide dehydrogenase medium subunit
MYTQRPAEFTYHRPTSVDEAVELLAGGEEVRALAGGHSLLPLMKLRLSVPTALVDLRHVPGLDTIEEEDGGVRIGAMVTYTQIARSDVVDRVCPVLAAASHVIGDRQVRNRGTLGGSLVHADPGGDYPVVVKALGATVTARGAGGERQIACDDLCTGLFETSLQAGELLTSVFVPGTGNGTGAAYQKHRHPASGYSVASVAAVVSLAGGRCERVRLTVGGVTPVPQNADAAAGALASREPTPEAIAEAAGRVGEALTDPLSDTYSSGEYRIHLATVLARRALAQAVAQAGG